MQIVITNDDGYGEPGLAALHGAASAMGQIVVVAPKTPQSFAGHRVTLKDALRADRIDARTVVVHGSPADCTRLALKHFAPDASWVISGINPGANLGTDVYQSGTVAAAREAAILGVAAIAVSQYIGPGRTIDWELTARRTAELLPLLMQQPLEPGQYWNVNLPHPAEADAAAPLDYQFCPLDKNPHDYGYSEIRGSFRYRGSIHERPRTAGADVDVCFGGKVAITRLEI